MAVTLGLIVYGDYALAAGKEAHVGFVSLALAGVGGDLRFAWLLPANIVELSASLHEAWQRPYPVVCMGGMGDGVDDLVLPAVQILQTGRKEMGQPSLLEQWDDNRLIQYGNVHFFSGAPEHAHPQFERWLSQQNEIPDAMTAVASESLPWQLPETQISVEARLQLSLKHPELQQRIIAARPSGFQLRISGPSRGKVQAGRKTLQARLKKTS